MPIPGHRSAPVGADKALAESLEEIHEAGASMAYVLLGLHVAAALYQHDVLRDNALRRMLPGPLTGAERRAR